MSSKSQNASGAKTALKEEGEVRGAGRTGTRKRRTQQGRTDGTSSRIGGAEQVLSHTDERCRAQVAGATKCDQDRRSRVTARSRAGLV